MSTILWVVGEPGVGKTTLVRELITWAGPRTARDVKPKWDVYGGRMATAGHYDGQTFDGADRLPIGDIYPALAHWAAYLSNLPLTVLDGDKLATARARASITIQSPFIRQLCVRVLDDASFIAARRAARSMQNPSWVKGRATKAWNFFHTFDRERRLEVDLRDESMARQGLIVWAWCGMMSSNEDRRHPV
jgi:hypothetical protein